MFPATVAVWSLRVQGGYIPRQNLLTRKRLACVAAKWAGSDEMMFWSEWDDGPEKMVREIWRLIDEADWVVHYNGLRADLPWLWTEFAVLGLPEPSPFKSVDLYRTVRRKFDFMSSSLEFVCASLGLPHKTDSGGMATFLAVMNGDDEARLKFSEYCKNDVAITEALYERVKTYISKVPNQAQLTGNVDPVCPACGSESYRSKGWTYLASGAYKRYQCRDCSRFFRDRGRSLSAEFREVAS